MTCIVAVERRGAAFGPEACEYIFDDFLKARTFAEAESDRKYQLRSGGLKFPTVQVQGETREGFRVSWRF